MKKFLCVVLVLSLSIFLFACSPKEEASSSLPDITFDPTPAATPVVVEKEKSTVEGVTITGEGVNIRSKASTDCEILGEADKGEIYKLLDKSNKDWFKISYKGKDAFVSTTYAKAGQVDASKLTDAKGSGSSEASGDSSSKDASSKDEGESSKEDESSSKDEGSSSKALNASDIRNEEDPQPPKRSEN